MKAACGFEPQTAVTIDPGFFETGSMQESVFGRIDNRKKRFWIINSEDDIVIVKAYQNLNFENSEAPRGAAFN